MASISAGALIGAMFFELLSRLVDSTPVLFSFALELLATLVLILFGAREPASREARAPLPENEAYANLISLYKDIRGNGSVEI